MTGVWITAGAVLVALLFGGYRALTDGRFRGRLPRERGTATFVAEEVADEVAPLAPVATTWHGRELGERATLVQFSSAFCAPCRVTRAILEEVAATEPGIVHVDIDAEHELALVRELGIMRTPTTLILDRTGRELARAAGAPRRDQVLAALPE